MSREILCYNICTDSSTKFFYKTLNSIICPCCGTNQKPTILTGAFNKNVLFLFGYCECCQKTYIAEYSYEHQSIYCVIKNFIKSYPSEFKHSHFSNSIKKLSERFIKIYEQALTAEAMGLDEIYGTGYRKALEFLVKDYLIDKNPNDKDNISKQSLNNSINMLTDEHIKNFAHSCRILGNDNTHYIQTFTTDDFKDIKSLIDYIVNFITNEMIYKSVMNKTTT